MRDIQLDNYRAISMIYVVCVIHMLYWLKIGTEPFMSLTLVEMPLIFFISGASLSVSKNNKDFFTVCINRIKRVIIPYYIYAFVMVLVVSLLSVVWYYEYPRIEKMFGANANKYMFDITSYSFHDVLQILACREIPQAPCVWHLWFILPYFILSCFFNVHKSLMTKISNREGYCLLWIVVFFAVQYVTQSQLIRNLFFYNIFMLIGYCYYRNIQHKQLVIACLVTFVILLIFVFGFNIKFCPMQSHKFPPDSLFLIYNLFALCVLSLVFGKIKIPQTRLLTLWNQRGYTIYLYQSIVYFVVFALYIALIQKIPNRFIQSIIAMFVLFFLSTGVSYISYPFEQFVKRNSIWSKLGFLRQKNH